MGTMSRSDRNRMARIDSILGRMDAAEKRALMELREAGVFVTSLPEARAYQAEYREAARLQAHAIERMGSFTTTARRAS